MAEARAVGGELVEIGREEGTVAVGAEAVPAVLIVHEEEDVGAAGARALRQRGNGRGGGGCEAKDVAAGGHASDQSRGGGPA